jgi:hypothetical protein
MLEFNKDHVKAKLKKVINLENFKKVAIATTSGIVMVACLTALLMPKQVLPMLGVDMEPQYVSNQMQEMVQKSELGDNPGIALGAQKIDYYESIDPTMGKIQNSGVLEGYANPNGNVKTATFDDFKNSVERTNLNIDYMNKKGQYIAFSKEEIDNFKKELFTDYGTINEYVDNNKSNDYNDFYSEILNQKIKKAFEEKGIENFKLNDITIHEENIKNKYAELDMTINDENTRVYAGDYLFNIFKSMNDADRQNYAQNINNLISGKFEIDMDSHEINNYTETKKEQEKAATSIAGSILTILLITKINNYSNNEKSTGKVL